MGDPRSRIKSLDGLRGAAALVVLVHHSLLVIPLLNDDSRGINATPLHVFWAGREAVYIFFILSGLVLTMPALRRSLRWRAYYPSRLIRLYIPVVVAVALGWIITTLIPRTYESGQSEWLRIHQLDATPLTYLRDAFLLSGTSNVNTPLWSLQWEVVFSLLLPAYIWAAIRLRNHWMMGILVSVLLSVAGAGLHFPPLTYLPMFLVGALLATRLESIQTIEPWLARGRGAGLAVLAVLGITAAYWASLAFRAGVGTVTLPLVIISAATIVGLAVSWPPFRAVLSRRFFQWAGRISFSLYLTHELIVVSVGQLLPASLDWLTPVIAIPIALAVAAMFFHFVEAPAHELSKRVAAVMRKRGTELDPPVAGQPVA